MKRLTIAAAAALAALLPRLGLAAETAPMTTAQAKQVLAQEQLALDPSNLTVALVNGELKQVEALLVLGIDPNQPPQTGLQMAMMGCAGEHVPTEVTLKAVDLLLAHGAKVNAPGIAGMSALINAVQQCPAPIVERLVKAGADINAPTEQGYTPLAMAIIVHRYDNANALIDAGARLSDSAAHKLLDGQDQDAELQRIIARARGV
jgi:ankyrin repeat protein